MAQAVNMRRLFLLSLLWAGPGCRGQRGEFLAMLTVPGSAGLCGAALVVVVTWDNWGHMQRIAGSRGKLKKVWELD